ncbi:MAG: hypothetical protein AAGU17_01135 [Anaerolineaceae bacterium]|jgi:hypothetical protein
MAALISTQIKINNILGVIEEYLDCSPVWNEMSEFEKLDFDTEWCNAIGQFESLEKNALPVEDQKQIEIIANKILELKPMLVEHSLLLPKDF